MRTQMSQLPLSILKIKTDFSVNRHAMYNFVLVSTGPPITGCTIRTIFLISLRCEMNSVVEFLLLVHKRRTQVVLYNHIPKEIKLRLLSHQKHSCSCNSVNISSYNNNFGVLVRLHHIAPYTSLRIGILAGSIQIWYILTELRCTLNLFRKL